MRKIAVLASAAALAATMGLSSTVAWSHHSVQNEFDVNQVVTRIGVLRKIDWINPHAWFHFTEVDENGAEVLDAAGHPIVWSLETTGPNGLRRLGLADRRMFVVGEVFAFSGYPHRTGATKMFTLQIKFPDDRIMSMGFPEDQPDLAAIKLPVL
jgi:hypothetical protein